MYDEKTQRYSGREIHRTFPLDVSALCANVRSREVATLHEFKRRGLWRQARNGTLGTYSPGNRRRVSASGRATLQKYEAELLGLSATPYLNSEDLLEEIKLKKMKLYCKDEMERIAARVHRARSHSQ